MKKKNDKEKNTQIIKETCLQSFDEFFRNMDTLKTTVQSGDEAQVKELFRKIDKASATISESLKKLKNSK